MSQHSEPWYRELPFWASIETPKFLLNASNIWLFWSAAFYVCLKEKTDRPNYFTCFIISFLIVVTSHVVLYCCVWSSLPLRIFPIFFPCPGIDVGCLWCFYFFASIGFVSMGFVSMFVRKIFALVRIFLLDGWWYGVLGDGGVGGLLGFLVSAVYIE